MSSLKKVLILFVFSGLTVGVLFNNCSKSDTGFSDVGASNNASSAAAENLLGLLDDAKETEARLREHGTPIAIAQANEIRKYIDIIENLIGIEGGAFSIDAPIVLDNRDYLLNSHLMGRDMLLEFDFNAAIAALQAEDQRLSSEIQSLEAQFQLSLDSLETRLRNEMQASEAQIQAEIAKLRDAFDSFRTQVENRFVQIDGRLVKIENITNILEDRIDAIDSNILIIQNNITIIQDTSSSALKALWEALEGLKGSLQAQIISLKEEQNEMKKKLAKQQEAFQGFLNDQNQLASIQGKMCKLDALGAIVSGQTACDASSSEDDVLDGNCCFTADSLDCDMMFAGESESSNLAKNQCNAFIVTLKNRDAQVKELAEADEQQKKDIAALMEKVKSIDEQLQKLTAEVKSLITDLGRLKEKIANINDRLLIVEFKAARSEAGAGLNEMSDLYLAWITRRKMDVRNRFCRSNSHRAYNRSDYGVARHNWAYCHERLKWLNQAQELVYLAKAYTNGVLSTNVDQNCSAVVDGVNAESLTVSQLSNLGVAKRVIDSCSSGQALVKALLLSIVQLHSKIGPDFRTAEYLATKAKIVQLLYFGDEVHKLSSAEIRDFENIDPTSDKLKNTYYGKVERVFKRRYVETRLRVNGKFPTDPSKFKGNVAGFNAVYSHEQIDGAANAYLKRLKVQELESHCAGECGFKVVSRNNVRKIGNRYSYPTDAKTQCPIHNDIVMVPSKDGKHYAYRLNYTRYRGATENLSPYWHWRNNHYSIANSDAERDRGQFRQCGYRVRHLVHRFGMPDTKLRGRLVLRYGKPYAKTHGLPQCMRFHFTCRLWEGNDGKGEWISKNPEANIVHFLSGYSQSKVQSFCSTSGASYEAKTRALSEDEKKTMRYYKAQQDAGSVAYADKVSSSTTQLTDKYWMLQDAPISYGVGNEKTSQAEPFYGKRTSHGFAFFRKLFRLTDFSNIDVQQCYDPN